MSTSRSMPGIAGFTRGVSSSSTYSRSSSVTTSSPATTTSSAVGVGSAGVSGAGVSGAGASGAGASGASAAGVSCDGVSSGSLTWSSFSAMETLVLLLLLDQCHRLRLLRRVRMLGARVPLQLRELLTAEAVAGHHSLDREADDLLRPALEHVVERAGLQAARVARMAVVHLVRALTPGDRDLLRVDDHHEVPGVDVRGVRGLALAAQGVGDLGRQTAEGLPLGVDDEPVALAVRGFGDVGLHSQSGRGRRFTTRGSRGGDR